MQEIMGTAFLVHGTWYLRYLNGGGAMVPIEADKTVIEKLQDNRSTRLFGYMSTDGQGCARAVQATEIELLGRE